MYYLLGTSILAASLNNILLNKAQITEKSKLFRFNLFGAFMWCIILFVANKGSVHIDSQVLFWGIVYGLTQSLFILFKSAAVGSGSVSVTTLIGNCSLFISVLVSLIVWGESVTVIDVLGLVILLAAIFMCTYKKTNTSYTSKWKYYVFFFFVFAALVGIVFKAFGKMGNLDYCGDMMFVSAVVMVICYSVICLFQGGFKYSSAKKTIKNECFLYAIACGILSCLYNRLNIFLAGNIDAIIFFPAFNGGVILLSTFLGMWLCKEVLAQKQKIGILAGVIAICLTGIL
ncbi:MAG TPA: hypothetical protein DD391_06665 [Clostridiales bacterium]|jgi:uncharacterized membrane protein|nr:hypothetical protein [Clostridiales bacterium]HBL82268.1 hypothetical protein [Clostridiales bacterium]